MNKIRVAVVYGGRSVEHEVSIISALQAVKNLNAAKYEPVPLYITKEGVWYTGEALLDLSAYRDVNSLLAKCQKVIFHPNRGAYLVTGAMSGGLFKKPFEAAIDVVLPVIHGTHGEDGCLQGLLELSGVPYAGPGVLGGAIGMDKITMKAVLKEAGIPVPEYHWFYYWQWQDDPQAVVDMIARKIPYPMIVKPANLGSSIGITKVQDKSQLEDAIDLAGSFANRILVEQLITPLREINCAVLGSPEKMEVSLCEEPFSTDEILSFRDKYISAGSKSASGMSGAKRRLPADIPDQLTIKIEELSRRTFVATDGYGVCRIDFLMNEETKEIYVNEINTIPGSLSFYLWEPKGKSFTALLDDLIDLALKRSRRKEKMVFTYASNILAQGGFKGGKGGKS